MLEKGKPVEILLSRFRQVFIACSSGKVGVKRSEKIKKIATQEVNSVESGNSLGIEARERKRI